MKITKIELKDFRTFKGTYVFNLHSAGHNLLVYGENGSGKSSLFQALDRFLATTEGDTAFLPYQNIFVTTDDGFVKIHLDDPTTRVPDPDAGIYEWSSTSNPVGKDIICDAAKTHGALDYRDLLRTYFLHHGDDKVNLFHLLIEGLLAQIPNPANNHPFGADWDRINQILNGRLGWRRREELEELIEVFNAGWITTITGLQDKARDILREFSYPIEIELLPGILDFETGPKRLIGTEVILKATYCGQDIGRHQDFLNEAKLSAIALSIYFGALLQLPASKLRLLLLDDVLIGLDMVNRFPVIDILKTYFSDYQILFTTYDREWFEIVKEETKDVPWATVEITCGRGSGGHDLPVVAQNSSYMSKAEIFLNEGEYGGAANYLRKEMERVLKKYCEDHRVPIPYVKKIAANNLWEGLCKFPDPANIAQMKIDITRKASVERYRRVVFNAGSHDDVRALVAPEVRAAIDEVKQLATHLGVT